ncbi:MAG: hypothetical protein WBN75_05130 [Verrucomicrobiia bacterium]
MVTDLLEAIKDRNWLVRVSATICQHWHKKSGGAERANLLAFRTVDGGGGTA